MNAWDRQTTVSSAQDRTIDQGLRSYMLRIYNYMASGVLLTGIIAYVAGTNDAFLSLIYTQSADGRMGMSPLGWIVALAPLAMVFFMMVRLRTMSTSTLKATFWVYAALMGLSLMSLFMVYTQTSILRVFFITAGTFGVMSMYGYATKKDLTSWGSFLIVGVFAVLIASVVNMFLHSSGLQIAMSYIGVGLGLGLTAYDTQKLKGIYYQAGGNEDALQRASVLGALNLYMDFVYLFVNLMQIMGNRR